jgi:hypothetical protein
MVVAGIVGCLVLFVTLVQHYPQVMTGGDHGWGAGVAFNVAAAGYLGLACLLPRRYAVVQRNSLYALAAALVVAAAAAQYIARPSLAGLWLGPVPAIAGTGCRAWRFRPRLPWPACAGAASRTGWKPLCGPPCWQA